MIGRDLLEGELGAVAGRRAARPRGSRAPVARGPDSGTGRGRRPCARPSASRAPVRRPPRCDRSPCRCSDSRRRRRAPWARSARIGRPRSRRRSPGSSSTRSRRSTRLRGRQRASRGCSACRRQRGLRAPRPGPAAPRRPAPPGRAALPSAARPGRAARRRGATAIASAGLSRKMCSAKFSSAPANHSRAGHRALRRALAKAAPMPGPRRSPRSTPRTPPARSRTTPTARRSRRRSDPARRRASACIGSSWSAGRSRPTAPRGARRAGRWSSILSIEPLISPAQAGDRGRGRAPGPGRARSGGRGRAHPGPCARGRHRAGGSSPARAPRARSW